MAINIKDIKGFEKYVIHIDGYVLHKQSGRKLYGNDNKGYRQVYLYQDNKKGKWKYLHRLVSEAFIPNPENKTFINHKNGIRSDNGIENLEWCTPSENSIHAFKILNRIPGKKGKTGHLDFRSLRVKQINKDGTLVKIWIGINECARSLGLDGGHIIKVCKGDRKTHGGYIFKYDLGV